MEIILIFLNPKKCLKEINNRNLLNKLIPFYIILFSIIIFYLNRVSKSREIFYGSIVQLLFNIIFLIFISLFIKVFVKIFKNDRKFILSLSDTLLISIPSFALFFILTLFNYSYLNKLMYSLIFLFSYSSDKILNKALFFFYYPPRTLLFLYTFLGLAYIYNLSIKKALLITILIYFIIFIVYLL